MDLADHIVDSLSEKERRVDVIERRLLRAACDRQRCPPIHSVAFFPHKKADENNSTDSDQGSENFGHEKPWLSAADAISNVNDLSMEASSILDVR